MSLAQGSFHFLTGPSGAGKTTLMKLCYGELVAEQGTVALFGQNVRMMQRDDVAEMRRRIGVVHQDCQFLDHLSLAENIMLPLTVSAGHFMIRPNCKTFWLGSGWNSRRMRNRPSCQVVNGNVPLWRGR